MKKLIAIAIVMLGTAHAFDLQVDKVAHFGVGYMVTDIICELDPKNDDAKLYGLFATMLVATMKEAGDAHFDWQDWGYTVAGSVLCISIKF